MTSVADTSVKYFSSAMANAPVLNGTAGALIALLDACLVDGFGLKTANSLTVSNGVATLAFSGTHPAAVDSVVLVAGSSIAELNGEQKVTAVGSGTVSFATAAADGTASGTISFKMAPAGWVKAFSGTNKAAYKSGNPMATGCLLRVDDSAATYVRVVGYESMTDVDTGTGKFPLEIQMAGGGYWPKSGAANANPVGWFIASDGRFAIVHIAPMLSNNATYICGTTRGFGDIIPYRPSGDAYGCAISYANTSNVNLMISAGLDTPSGTDQAMPRAYTGFGSCVLHRLSSYSGSGTSGMDSSLGPFPSVIDGGIRFSRKYYAESSSSPPRGELPGLLHVPHSSVSGSFRTGDRVPGSGVLAGRTLTALTITGSSLDMTAIVNIGVSFVDITGPWR